MATSRAGKAFVGLLFALPFLIRFLYFIDTRDEPYLAWSFLVAYVNHNFAVDLASGQGGPYTLYRSPWYPALISLLYRVFGADPLVVRIFQWLLGACGCLLIHRLGRLLLGERQARAALLLAALFVPSVYYEGELLEQSTAAFFALAGLTLLASSEQDRAGALWSAPASVLYGLGFLMRPEVILSLPFVLAALAASPGPRARRWTRTGVFAAGCAAMLCPLLAPGLLIDVHQNNARINAAINFYIGNNARADGHSALLPDAPELPTIEPEARRDHMTGLDLAGIRYARGQTAGDLPSVAPFWLRRAAGFIASDPLAWLELLGRKCVLFFSGYMIGTQKDLYFLRDLSWVLRALLFCLGICFPLGLILPLAVAGAARPAAAHRKMLLLALPAGCLAATLLFFHDARFQYPAAPFLILLSSSGLFGLIEAIRARRWALPVLVAAALVVSNVDWFGTHRVFPAAEQFRVGTMYLDQRDHVLAGRHYRMSIQADPGFVPALENLAFTARQTGSYEAAISLLRGLADQGAGTAPLHRVLGGLYLEAGRPAEAIATLRAGAERFPTDDRLLLGLGDALMRRGECEEALSWLRKILARTRGEPLAWAGAGWCLNAMGRHSEAAELLREGLTEHPDDIPMLGLLGQAYGGLGRPEQEQACYRKVLALDPHHPEAAFQLARSLAAQKRTGEALLYARQAAALGHPGGRDLVLALESRPQR